MKLPLGVFAVAAATATAHEYKICPGTKDGLGLTKVGLSPDPVPSYADLEVSFTGTPTKGFDVGSKAKFTVKLLGLKLKTIEFDACKDLGLTCPVVPGQEVTGHISYHIPTYVPDGMYANVELVMVDQFEEKVTCVEVDAKLGGSPAMTAMSMAVSNVAPSNVPPQPKDGKRCFLGSWVHACSDEIIQCANPLPDKSLEHSEWHQTKECVDAIQELCPKCFEGVSEGHRSVHEASSYKCMKPCVEANGDALKKAGCRKPPKAMRQRFKEMREERAHHESRDHNRGDRRLGSDHHHDHHDDHHHDDHHHDDHHHDRRDRPRRPPFQELDQMRTCFHRLDAHAEISATCSAFLDSALREEPSTGDRRIDPIDATFRRAHAEMAEMTNDDGEEDDRDGHHHRCRKLVVAAAAALVLLTCVCCSCCARRRRRRTRARAEAAEAAAATSWTALGESEISEKDGVALGEVIRADGTPVLIIGEKLQPMVLTME